MAQYQKYMFDNFVIETPKENTDNEVVVDTENTAVSEPELEIVDNAVTTEETSLSTVETVDEKTTAPVVIEAEETFSREEMDNAVKLAEERGYEQGFQSSANDMIAKQNILLEELNNRMMAIFSEMDRQKTTVEADALRFALGLFRKMLPTLENTAAEDEVKKFLRDNFTNFVTQDSLSFSFHPDTLARIAKDLGRLAEQNDYEGKISVHKDSSLGLSDCRVEWKNGSVERNVQDVLSKVENLIDGNIGNIQERDNG